VHIKCISICSTYEKSSKNKSCIGCIAWHGMTYYIFLKPLRSLEEFRKNHHVKIPPKSPCANFQSFGKFRNPIFNSEILFPYFWPSRPCGPLDLWPSRLLLASPLPQAEAHRLAQAAQPTRAVGVIAEVHFLL
jgi:hypothetical protein